MLLVQVEKKVATTTTVAWAEEEVGCGWSSSNEGSRVREQRLASDGKRLRMA
ncbi:hypothetical protein BHM03_00008630 [Ensete ventricosum]|nr:hypothetical protein BHM03_00008630 [Ensete ventricosum]